MESTAVILGAGFSRSAGLPLAKDLFDFDIFAGSRAAERRFNVVLNAWRDWRASEPGQGPEQFLTKLYQTPRIGPVPWPWAVEYVAAVLATPLPQDRGAYSPRYAARITRPVPVAVHIAFWNVVLSCFQTKAVITTNYDILAERGLRHRAMSRPTRPGFFYGGLSRPQNLKGAALPFSVYESERVITLDGAIPLYKLHGSLNWSFEAGVLALYQDLRPAFRHGGDAQIVPPVLEKEAPSWLIPIWHDARTALASSSTWLVCGYSLPQYDKAITQLFRDAGKTGAVQKILLLDPHANDLVKRWRLVAPSADIIPLPGLPDAIERLADFQ